jgi:hypothetical protein
MDYDELLNENKNLKAKNSDNKKEIKTLLNINGS